jgi:hypothetical protein
MTIHKVSVRHDFFSEFLIPYFNHFCTRTYGMLVAEDFSVACRNSGLQTSLHVPLYTMKNGGRSNGMYFHKTKT